MEVHASRLVYNESTVALWLNEMLLSDEKIIVLLNVLNASLLNNR